MEKWNGCVALVTGASAGIGAALTEALVKHGLKVVACARNVDKIQALKSSLSGQAGEVLPVKCDLSDESQILAMFQTIRETYGTLHICINNAGLSHPAELLSGATKAWREMLDVNFLALCICTREAVKLMEEGGVKTGHIIHISSMSGHRITDAIINFYTCTKHAVKAHTEGLRRELRARNSGIRITAVSPGNVDTEFCERMFAGDPTQRSASQFKELDAGDIVDACVYALSCPPHSQVHDILIRPLGQDS